MTKKNVVPLKQDLWVQENDTYYLLGNKCFNCEEVLFPYKKNIFCPQCHTPNLEKVKLGRKGKISAVTIVNETPAGGFYKGAVPYCYGIVKLDDDVNVMAHFVEMDWSELEVGQEVELVIEQLYETDSDKIVTYKFKPIA